MDTNNSDCLNRNQAKTSETFHMVIGYRHEDELSEWNEQCILFGEIIDTFNTNSKMMIFWMTYFAGRINNILMVFYSKLLNDVRLLENW